MSKEQIKTVIITVLWFGLLTLFAIKCSAQVVGKTVTEDYKASFEKKSNIDSLLDYDGPKTPIQILSLGISEDVYAMYPELKDKRVGLGVTNIVCGECSLLSQKKYCGSSLYWYVEVCYDFCTWVYIGINQVLALSFPAEK